jgi:hypothetical protein
MKRRKCNEKVTMAHVVNIYLSTKVLRRKLRTKMTHNVIYMRGLESFEAEIKLAKADKKYLNQREADNGTC